MHSMCRLIGIYDNDQIPVCKDKKSSFCFFVFSYLNKSSIATNNEKISKKQDFDSLYSNSSTD